jgi:hypothetical protein
MPVAWCASCNQRPTPAAQRRSFKANSNASADYSGADLRHLYRIDPSTGCWMWLGPFRSYGGSKRELPIVINMGSKHRLCGVPHNAMSRTFFEEELGRPLEAKENVHGVCATNKSNRHACVNPAHHEIRRGAGEMFGREMS